jgi:hypothetical protein
MAALLCVKLLVTILGRLYPYRLCACTGSELGCNKTSLDLLVEKGIGC